MPRLSASFSKSSRCSFVSLVGTATLTITRWSPRPLLDRVGVADVGLPQQIASGKEMFHNHMTMDLAQAYAYANEFMAGAIQREDAQAGIDAFVNKKPKPDWKGR